MKVHAYRAWIIHACCYEWSLGGNQSADKHRMVPPFLFLTMKSRIFTFLAAVLLTGISAFAQSVEPIKGDVNGDRRVDVADIANIIDIMAKGEAGYFYFGNVRPTTENYTSLPGVIGSYTSISEASGATATIAAGETLYMMCPASWMEGNSVELEGEDGNPVSFLEEKDVTTISGYVIYRTQVLNDEINVVLKTQNEETLSKVADIVDLGLSVKWASWNVGAESPEGLGNLYAWGELSPKTDYSTSTYKFYDNGYTKYGSIDNKYQLDSEDDVAKQTWGDKWRIPTIEELKELKEKCTFTKMELNGVPVTKVTGPNGNFIYFPYPGNFTGTTLYYENSIGSYWSSDLENDSYAKDLDFLGGMPDLNGDSRYHGQSIRPVYVEKTDETFGTVADVVDLGLNVKWASWNVGTDKPEGLGNLYAWGELYPKTDYSTSTYIYYPKSEIICTQIKRLA